MNIIAKHVNEVDGTEITLTHTPGKGYTLSVQYDRAISTKNFVEEWAFLVPAVKAYASAVLEDMQALEVEAVEDC